MGGVLQGLVGLGTVTANPLGLLWAVLMGVGLMCRCVRLS